MTQHPQQIPLDLQSVPALGREDFFVGTCNRFAVHWVEEWPKAWHPFPALIIYGEKGSGKTHLAEVWRKKSRANLINTEDFKKLTDDDIVGYQNNLVIDGCDSLCGSLFDEQKLFHLYNHFLQSGYFAIFLFTQSPERIDFVLPDLASRLRAVPQAEISTPDDDILLKVMAKRFHDQGFVVATHVLNYAVTRMERSWKGMDRFIAQAIIQATAEKKQITLPLIKSILESG
jgi:chromosomal replication initiation ATPase DnaA